MSILKEKKDDWSETLVKGYYYDEVEDKEVNMGYALFTKPYLHKFDFGKNSIYHMFERSDFRDNNYFDDTTINWNSYYDERI